MMQENFLNFVAHLFDNCCPWTKSVIKTYPTSIEVRFITTTMVKPSDLGWLNTHCVGGEWFVTSQDDETHIVLRFYEDDENL